MKPKIDFEPGTIFITGFIAGTVIKKLSTCNLKDNAETFKKEVAVLIDKADKYNIHDYFNNLFTLIEEYVDIK